MFGKWMNKQNEWIEYLIKLQKIHAFKHTIIELGYSRYLYKS